jgi:hypothetical protein
VFDDFFVACVYTYPVVQLALILLAKGIMRLVACIPLFVMLFVYAQAAYAFWTDSNLWWLYVYFVSPIALLAALIIGLVMALRHKRTL